MHFEGQGARRYGPSRAPGRRGLLHDAWLCLIGIRPVVRSPAFGSGDPNCCTSCEHRERTDSDRRGTREGHGRRHSRCSRIGCRNSGGWCGNGRYFHVGWWGNILRRHLCCQRGQKFRWCCGRYRGLSSSGLIGGESRNGVRDYEIGAKAPPNSCGAKAPPDFSYSDSYLGCCDVSSESLGNGSSECQLVVCSESSCVLESA